MHFRVRQNTIQLIRTTYDSSKKKGVNTTVGKVALKAPELTTELRQSLTADEIAAFENYVTTHHRAATLREEMAFLELPATLEQAGRWIEHHGADDAMRALAPEILSAWSGLRKALKKADLAD